MDLLADEDHAPQLSINQEFAQRYEHNKRREELSKLQDKYGPDADDGGSSDEESTDYSSEDSDAEFVTPQVDAAILKVIGRIRKGDQALYSSNKDLFEEEEKQLARKLPNGKSSAGKKDKSKPVHLKDFQRKALLAGAHNGEDNDTSRSNPTPAQEAEDLRRETKAAFLAAVDGNDAEDGESNDDDLLVQLKGHEDEDDEDQYRRFLLENVGEEELEKALTIRKEAERAEAEGQNDDEFLKTYILNRGWLDKSSKKRPLYAEIAVDEEETPQQQTMSTSGANAIPLMEDDDEEFERAEEFETKYNFRFEEAAGNDITTHARDTVTSVRRVDETRKQSREARKARKAAEKAEKMAELERLKELKRQEIMEKVAKIQEVVGSTEGLDLSALDLEGEYDPEKHDSQMAKLFGDAWYAEKTDAKGKPIWEDDIDIDDIVPGFSAEQEEEGGEDYAPGGDAYDPTAPSGKKSRAERKKEKKNKNKRGKEREDAVDGAHDVLDPQELDAIADPEERRKLVEKYMDDLYNLDHEDMVGDLPTRFHYVSSGLLNPAGTQKDEYSLTPAEILMATDAELNAYESLKKIAPYRQGTEKDIKKKRKRLKELRKAISRRQWGEELPEDAELAFTFGKKRTGDTQLNGNGKRARIEGCSSGEPTKKKRMGPKQRKKLKTREQGTSATAEASAAE